MFQTEHLLAKLAERERQLHKMQAEVQRAGTMAQVFDLVHGCDDVDSCLHEVLELCRKATGSNVWMLFGVADTGVITVEGSNEAGLQNVQWPQDTPVLLRDLNVNDLREPVWAGSLPKATSGFLSMLSAPIKTLFQNGLAIGLLSRQRAAYSSDDLDLLCRVAHVLEQALSNRVLVHRNAMLNKLFHDDDDTAEPAQSRFFDNAFQTLSQTLRRVTDWQGQIVDITNELLCAQTSTLDTAINRALERMGKLASADRTYVFKLDDANRMNNTHEWVAPGIEPMIESLQNLPVSLLDHWMPNFKMGEPIHIPDVDTLPGELDSTQLLKEHKVRSLLIVPMFADGVLSGFVGHDAVMEQRSYLPVEIQLLESVCNAIGAVLERKKAEHRATMARESLHATLLALPDLVLELDRSGHFTSVYEGTDNGAAFPPEDFIGRTPEEVLPDSLARLSRKIMAHVDLDGRTEAHEYQMEIKGTLRSFQASASAKMIDGERVGYVMLIRDITESTKARRDLQRLSKIAELTSNHVLIIDAQRRIEWVNPAYERFTGWKLDEVRTKRPHKFMFTENTDRAELMRIDRALAARKPVRSELLFCDRKGEEYWISMDIQPMFDKEGEVEGFVAVQTDITELKRSHMNALRDRAAALEASNDGIAITDETGHFVYMNPEHRKMFGFGLTQEIEQVHWTDLYTSEGITQFMTDVWPEIETHGFWRGELYGRDQNGQTVPQEVSLTRQESGLLCITRDISNRLRLEAERVRMSEELQIAQSRETISHITSGVAHDLNNLVAVVAGSATLLRAYCAESAEALSGVERILRATETAKELVGGLGHLGRPQRARGQHDLRTIIREAIDLLGSQRIRTHQIAAIPQGLPCPVWGNVTEVLQVAINLALNACQSTGRGPNIVRFYVSDDMECLPKTKPDVGWLKPGLDYVLFSVTDTGTGIDETARTRIFERHFTTKGPAGTGLGLPIVAGILRDNDGALWIDSTIDVGTTVTVAWPSATSTTDPVQALTQTAAQSVPLDLNGHRILVVDDLPDVADVLSEMLDSAGAVSATVSDPREALELLQDNPDLWSALVTDLEMGGLRGTDLARAARDLTPSVPTVLVTALPNLVGEDAGLFHTILSKPVTAADLIATVCGAVAKGNLLPTPENREK
jgi:PAS domain S-box-containing protein